MRTIVVTPPSEPITDAPTVRARLKLPSAVLDATIDAYIAAAVANLDGPDGIMGRALGPQQLQLQAGHFPGFFPGHFHWRHGYQENWRHSSGEHHAEILLSYPEIISVDSITYFDPTGAVQTVDPSTYIVSGRRIVPAPGLWWWPQTQWPRPDAVTILYHAGYTGAIPANIIQAIVLMVGAMNTMGRPDMLVKQDTVIGVQSLQWETAVDVMGYYARAITALLAPSMVWSRDA